MMYAGRNLFLHGLSPLAALISWSLVERGQSLRFGWVLLGLIPTALYAAVYGDMVLRRKKWEDFYGFNQGGAWPVAVFAMLVLSFAIVAGLRALRM